MREYKEQTPQLTLLYCGRTVRSSHRRCSIKKLFLKISQYPQETPVLESLFKKVAGLQACNFIKKRSQHRCFPMNIAKLLRLTILKSIGKRLLFNCFNGSLFHGPKGSKSRLYDGFRLQGPSHSRSNFFVFKSASVVLNRIPTCVWRQIPLMSQISFYIGYFRSF